MLGVIAGCAHLARTFAKPKSINLVRPAQSNTTLFALMSRYTAPHACIAPNAVTSSAVYVRAVAMGSLPPRAALPPIATCQVHPLHHILDRERGLHTEYA